MLLIQKTVQEEYYWGGGMSAVQYFLSMQMSHDTFSQIPKNEKITSYKLINAVF
jgi:hypothetical protein